MIRTASLVLLTLLAGALGAACGASTTTTSTTPGVPGGSAAPETSSMNDAALSGSTISSTASHPASLAAAAAIARIFATAYGRYLDRQLPAVAIPDATSAARTQAGPMIPPARRAGTLAVQSVKQTPASATFTIVLRDQAHTFTAELRVAPVSGRWLVVAVTPPDLDTILAPKPRSTGQPAGSAQAEHATRMFMSGYLAWLSGHAPLRVIKTTTGRLLVSLKAHPPRVPPPMQTLRPQVAAIAMQRRGSHWQALANLSDGHETYELVLAIARTREGWLVNKISLP